MAIYRNIQMSFWTDTKVTEDFTPDDKLVYLYLLTNPNTNLCGCYEIAQRMIVNDTGLPANRVKTAMCNLERKHKVITYSTQTREMLIINWHKYNWTNSDKFRKPLEAQIKAIKNTEFREYLADIFKGMDTVSIPYGYRMDTTCMDTACMDTTVSVSVTDTVTDTVEEVTEDTPIKRGENGNVLLTDKEVDRLIADYGEDKTRKAIEYLDLYIPDKGYKVKSQTHYFAIRRWVIDAVTEQEAKRPKPKNDDAYMTLLKTWAEG